MLADNFRIGMKPNAFSITIDTRFYPQGITEAFYEIIAAIVEKNASLVSFLSRDVFTNENDFEAAVENLSNGELIVDVYYIVAGSHEKLIIVTLFFRCECWTRSCYFTQQNQCYGCVEIGSSKKVSEDSQRFSLNILCLGGSRSRPITITGSSPLGMMIEEFLQITQ